VKYVCALALVALALPASSMGQATRTWVSGVGDDANPCSRTAPCKTFAGSISKTAIGGIINVLDDGGFGAVTITKSITIDGHHHIAGILAANTNGIIINPTTSPGTVRVVLRGLDIEGNNQSNPLNAGLNGVRFLAGRSLKIFDSDIYQFSQNGVENRSSTDLSTLVIDNTRIHENGGNGVVDAPGSTLAHKVTIRNSSIDENTCGVAASTFGMTNTFGTFCGTGGPSPGGAVLSKISVINTGLSDNDTGILARGTAAVVRISGDTITGSNFGLRVLDTPTLLSAGNNLISGNANSDAPTGSAPLSKRAAR
jgi:hypothetical protein